MIEIEVGGEKYTLRNIQEQVQKNKEDIAAFRSAEAVMADFGITVLGHLENAQDIPPREYEYGDAWLVGINAPYEMYIYTRTDVPGEGQFVDLGPIAIEGPQGPQGEPGRDGVDGVNGVDGTSVTGSYGSADPLYKSTDKKGDIYINKSTQHLWMFNGTRWNDVMEIKGPQGDAGIQGPQGATGTTLSIVNKLANTGLLPTNFSSGTIPKNSAYLIPDSQGANHLWIILGQQADYSTWQWHDAGDFNLGSVVYKDGNFQYSLDVQTSIDAVAPSQTSVPTSHAVALEVDRQVQDMYDSVVEPLESQVTTLNQTMPRTLKTPLQAPTETKMVGYDSNNNQVGYGIGSGLKIESGTIKTNVTAITDNRFYSTNSTSIHEVHNGRFAEAGIYMISVSEFFSAVPPLMLTVVTSGDYGFAQKRQDTYELVSDTYALNLTTMVKAEAGETYQVLAKESAGSGSNRFQVLVSRIV